MKRIVSLIDGTWNEEGKGNDTNIAKLDPNQAKAGSPWRGLKVKACPCQKIPRRSDWARSQLEYRNTS